MATVRSPYAETCLLECERLRRRPHNQQANASERASHPTLFLRAASHRAGLCRSTSSGSFSGWRPSPHHDLDGRTAWPLKTKPIWRSNHREPSHTIVIGSSCNSLMSKTTGFDPAVIASVLARPVATTYDDLDWGISACLQNSRYPHRGAQMTPFSRFSGRSANPGTWRWFMCIR